MYKDMKKTHLYTFIKTPIILKKNCKEIWIEGMSGKDGQTTLFLNSAVWLYF